MNLLLKESECLNRVDCICTWPAFGFARKYLVHTIFVVLLIALQLVSTPAVAATLDYPDLDLSSSPASVRAWAKANKFVPVNPAEPYDEAYQLETSEGMPVRHVLSFVADSNGLKILSFDQFGILTASSILRRDIVRKYGEPSADQILGGRTLRITFPLEHTEPARRIFLIDSGQLSMLMVTEDFFAQLKGETDRHEQAEELAKQQAAEAERQAEIKARLSWLIPMGWAAGIAIGGFVLIQLLPVKIRKPVVRILGRAFGGMISFGLGVGDTLFRVLMGIVIFGMMIFSALTIGVGAAEWGTSWWWGLFWLAGFGTMVRHNSPEGIELRPIFIALAMFVAGIAGVFLQQL